MVWWLLFFVIAIPWGWFFSIPVFEPSLRLQAKRSKFTRRKVMITLSLLSFLTFLIFLAYLSVFLTNTQNAGYVSDNDEVRDSLLNRELFLHFSAPPFLLSNDNCFADDDVVCRAAKILLNYNHTTWIYFIKLMIALIPPYSCGVYVWYLTRDNRKEKVK